MSERPSFPQSRQTWNRCGSFWRGASVTAQDEQGMIALIAAAYQNKLSITDLLIPSWRVCGV